MPLFYGAVGARYGLDSGYRPPVRASLGQLSDGTLPMSHLTPSGQINPRPVFQAMDNRPAGPPVVVSAVERPAFAPRHQLGRFLTQAELMQSLRR